MDDQLAHKSEHSWWHNTRNKWVCCICPPETTPIMYRQTTTGVLVLIILLVMWIPISMIIWAPIATTNNNGCDSDLESLENKLEAIKELYHEFKNLTAQCYANCGLVHCNSCCPGCPWGPAPLPPTSADLWRFPTRNNSLCIDNAYASFVPTSALPAFACRFAQFQFTFCGFLNDYSLSLLEIPSSPPTGYGNGTVVASKLAASIPNGQFCVPVLGAYGPNGNTTYILQGDQTGFTLSFVVTTIGGIAGATCSATLCSELIM
jgi:hypothetical protein